MPDFCVDGVTFTMLPVARKPCAHLFFHMGPFYTPRVPRRCARGGCGVIGVPQFIDGLFVGWVVGGQSQSD